MHRMTIERRAVLALLGATGTACMLPRPASAAAPLNFGYDEASSWGVIGMVAKAKDLFKKAGADVDYHTFDSGKATRDAMLSGHIDLGILGSTPFILGAAKGEVIAIAMAMYAGKTDAVVVGAKSDIKSMQDLKGRRVASELGTSTDYVFQAELLPKYGLSPSDLHIINTQGPNMIAALVSGSVDAIVDTEPFVSIAQADNIGKVIADYRVGRHAAGRVGRQPLGGGKAPEGRRGVPARLARDGQAVRVEHPGSGQDHPDDHAEAGLQAQRQDGRSDAAEAGGERAIRPGLQGLYGGAIEGAGAAA